MDEDLISEYVAACAAHQFTALPDIADRARQRNGLEDLWLIALYERDHDPIQRTP